MTDHLAFQIAAQPDDTTCGPTCLHAVYRYWGLDIALPDLIAQTRALRAGGTLDVFLACDALRRGFDATIYTYNLQTFDPSWFADTGISIGDKLRRQLEFKGGGKLGEATEGYIEFLELGGRLRFEDLTTALIRRYLKRSVPILTGLSATYLYRTPREFGPNDDFDDVRGEPSGHFVVMHGYDPLTREVKVADPTRPGEFVDDHMYRVSVHRAIGAIMLGVLTHDANLLMIQPRRRRRGQ